MASESAFMRVSLKADKAEMSADDVIEEIEQVLEHARPVPLTDQVRLSPDRLRELLAKLREELAAERRR